MGAYNYKQVCHREDFSDAEKEWEKAEGVECDGDPGYDGHYWLITAYLLDKKDAEIADLRSRVEALERNTP